MSGWSLKDGIPGCLAATAIVCGLVGCGAPATVQPTLPPIDIVTATATEADTPTPAPVSALDPAQIWVGVEGTGDSIASVAADETVTRVHVPLNEGQLASNLVASADGRLVAYLVITGDNEEHGIAVWDPTEPNARLVMSPLPGYRIIALMLASDASGLAYVQVQDGKPLASADWRIDRVPPGGGEPTLLADREMLDDVAPLVPFAWIADGPLLLNAAVPGPEPGGIYAVSPDGSGGRLLLTLDDQALALPKLSPNGTLLAYLAAAGGSPHTADIARVVDLRLDQNSDYCRA